jgi:NAD(P)-dependent dehydrogenase (short-subunit alcohol dehydrogenase family)
MSRKNLLVTGCSTGIGLTTALGLQERGYRVFATARKPGDLDMLSEQGLEALYLDYADSDSIRAAFDRVMQQTDGRLYGLFNNGAYGQPGAVEDLTRETLRKQFESNFFGWHELTRLVIPVMREQGEGRIVQNSSVLGFAAMPFRGAYNASKFALEGLTDTLRLELRGSGIHVSLVQPGPILSRFRANALTALRENIDIENSIYADNYKSALERLQKEGPAAPFTLPPEAVMKKVVHALESGRPKPRYYVTFPTYLFGYLKRILATRHLDWILHKAGGEGKR